MFITEVFKILTYWFIFSLIWLSCLWTHGFVKFVLFDHGEISKKNVKKTWHELAKKVTGTIQKFPFLGCIIFGQKPSELVIDLFYKMLLFFSCRIFDTKHSVGNFSPNCIFLFLFENSCLPEMDTLSSSSTNEDFYHIHHNQM